MIDNLGKGRKQVICDGCGDGFEAASFEEAIETIESDGWKKRKVDGEWTHYCPDCAGGL